MPQAIPPVPSPSNKVQYLLGAFEDRDHADKAVLKLIEEGYNIKDISVIAKYMEQEFIDRIPGRAEEIGKGVAAGAGSGGVAGGLAGLLASGGTIPILAGLVVAGPVATALGLTGAAAAVTTGAVAGGTIGAFAGFLVGTGISETDAEYYSKVVDDGGVVIAVPVDSTTHESAMIILRKFFAKRINLVDPEAVPSS